MKKGFTLIELLIVIGLVGILAGIVIVAVNPGEQFNSANDSRVVSDISTLARASENYFANRNSYALEVSDYVSAGELKSVLQPPTSDYQYNYVATRDDGSSCTTELRDCFRIIIYSTLKSSKHKPSSERFVYDSRVGKTCQIDDAVSPIQCP